MSTIFIDEILDGLVNEINNTIQGSGNYNTTPIVERGIKMWEETDGRRPFIFFVPVNIIIEELMGDTANINIEVELQGYADDDGYGGTSTKMYQLLKDIQYFLWNDYTQQIVITNIIPAEGSMYGDGQSGFLISFNIYVSVNTITINVIE